MHPSSDVKAVLLQFTGFNEMKGDVGIADQQNDENKARSSV